MKKTILLLLLVFVATGCSRVRRSTTELVPTRTDDEYRYFRYQGHAIVSRRHPLNDDSREAKRIEWLEKWLSDNGYSDYEILSRQPIVRSKGIRTTLYNIYYEVKVPKK